MTFPKEGSREIDEGIIISEPMDWCRSPTAIVPYRIWARQIEAADLAYSVRQTKDPSHVRGSVVLQCYGDEPGTGGGVISGTHNAECTPKTWSENVRAESRNMVRHDDEWWMNSGNTWGRLDYVKDMKSYPTPQVAGITPQMSYTKSLMEASYSPSSEATNPASQAQPTHGSSPQNGNVRVSEVVVRLCVFSEFAHLYGNKFVCIYTCYGGPNTFANPLPSGGCARAVGGPL